METNQKEQNLLELIEELKRKNKMLQTENEAIKEELAKYQNIGDETLKAIEFKKTMKELDDARAKYDEINKEMTEIKIEYEKKLKELVKQYTR